MTFLIDEIERPFTPDPPEALTDLRTLRADRLAAVEREVEAWSRSLRGAESAAYDRAEAVLSRLEKMPLGWWQRHAAASVTDLLALVPCGGCDGLVRPGYATVSRRAQGRCLCEGCGGVGAEEPIHV